jgi:type II secretory pathway predicted ATPase ExeA
MLFKMLPKEQLVAAKLVTTQLESEDLLRMVSAAFDLPHEQMSKTALLKGLEAFFQEKARRGQRVLLVIDEAQNIPKRSLEELRMLSNIETDGAPVLQIFLLGQEEFMAVMQAPDMEQLRQRVIATYQLKALKPEETPNYIEHRLRHVGWDNDPAFAAGTYDEIHAYTAGVPRRLNTFCDRLLLYAYLEEVHTITPEHVHAVARELLGETGRPRQAVAVSVRPAQWEEDVTGRLSALEKRLDEIEDAMVIERALTRGD